MTNPLCSNPYRGLIMPLLTKTRQWRQGEVVYAHPFVFRMVGQPVLSWGMSNADKKCNLGVSRMVSVDDWRIYKPAFLSAINGLFDVVIQERSIYSEMLYSTQVWYNDTKYPRFRPREDGCISIVCCNSTRAIVGTPEQTAYYMTQGLVDAHQLEVDDEFCAWGPVSTPRGAGYAAFKQKKIKVFMPMTELTESIGDFEIGHVIQSVDEARYVAKVYAKQLWSES
jgi:hypothetical protein